MKIEEAQGCTQAENTLGVVINHHKLALTQHLHPQGSLGQLLGMTEATGHRNSLGA